MANYHFSGYATRNDLRCSDGRTILKDAFKNQDGQEVPLVWNHDHTDPTAVLGHALLENREDGVYAYCTFNDSENAQHMKETIKHGDIRSLSIWANRLKQTRDNCVVHGNIREVSLVYAGANPGAFIDSVMVHGDDNQENENLIISYDEHIMLYHSDEEAKEPAEEEVEEIEVKKEEEEPMKGNEPEKELGIEQEKELEHAEEDSNGKTVQELFESAMGKISEDEQTAVHAVIGLALGDNGADDEDDEVEHSEGGEELMKTNVFDQEGVKTKDNVLSHADQEMIIELAKKSNVGSLKEAMGLYLEENDMMHADDEGDGVGIFEDYGVLFPELELLKKGEPETLYKYDNGWVAPALAKIHKSPFSRIRTRHADARLAELKAKGYQKKGDQKTVMGQIKMINRETTPQTIYIKDDLHRDDIVDITDFSIVAYQWKQMRRVLDETMILAAMIGDGREDDDVDKISEEHIRPIWKDNEEYTIHHDVDIEAARKELQGTETGQHFGDNYVYAEAIITAALYSREKFKGTGTPDFYCTPHLVNVMLLARDLNGRRIYDSKADLAKALNCGSIVEVEHFEGLTRETEDGKTKKLLGLFVNLNDYTFGSTRGGEITKFEDFDMDFNKQKFMLETRLSGSLYKLKSAIALEEPVNEVAAG